MFFLTLTLSLTLRTVLLHHQHQVSTERKASGVGFKILLLVYTVGTALNTSIRNREVKLLQFSADGAAPPPI